MRALHLGPYLPVNSPSTLIAKHCLVSGRVQGVFYRVSTQRQAHQLGCRGYARNLPDGRVEVLVVAPAPAVEALVAWLWHGPPAAQVTQVEVQALSLEALMQEAAAMQQASKPSPGDGLPVGFTIG